MSDQPDALRLIDTFVSKRDLAWHVSATAELRRLHEENEQLREQLPNAFREGFYRGFQAAFEDAVKEAALRQEDTK